MFKTDIVTVTVVMFFVLCQVYSINSLETTMILCQIRNRIQQVVCILHSTTHLENQNNATEENVLKIKNQLKKTFGKTKVKKQYF